MDTVFCICTVCNSYGHEKVERRDIMPMSRGNLLILCIPDLEDYAWFCDRKLKFNHKVPRLDDENTNWSGFKSN